MAQLSISSQQHWQHFHDFCRYELASGGPDPQLAMVATMSAGLPQDEQVWRAGCYIAVYNVAFAEAIWQSWPWSRVVAEWADMAPWLSAHWHQIVTRVERRCVRRPEWMNEFLIGWRQAAATYQSLAEDVQGMSVVDGYEVAWQWCQQVPRLGRYVALKLVEYLRRYCGLAVSTPDIRPAGGWSPRQTLVLLWPEEHAIAESSNVPEILEQANAVANRTQQRLSQEQGLQVDLFQLQVLLCEYRESIESGRQYPGRSLDSELRYARRAEMLWGHQSNIWSARAKLFPQRHLGEHRGWDGPREGPATALARYGYVWSDLLYDYHATLHFGSPVRWV